MWKEEARTLLSYLLDKQEEIQEDIRQLVAAIDNDQEEQFIMLDKKIMEL